MARITLTSLFSNLDPWPGRLFDEEQGGSVITRTASAFTWRHGAGSDFAGYEIRVTGTGFTYDGGEAIAGRMTQLRIVNAAGQTVITFANLGDGLAGDFSEFWYSFFGAPDEDNGPGGNQVLVWSHLMSGRDTIVGSAGEDDRSLVGLDMGDDRYELGDGDNYVSGGLGNDTYVGGLGNDIISFQDTHYDQGMPMIRGATVNLATGQVLDPWGGTDRLIGFDEARGSRLADVLTGNDERNRFQGMRGNDTIDGGNNSFTAGGDLDDDRRDEVRYHQERNEGGTRGIVVDLETSFANGSIRGTIRDSFGHRDTVIDIERVVGTVFNDTFVGSRANNQFRGLEGRDSYDGADGWDFLAFDWGENGDPHGLRIDLTRATGQIIDDGFGNTENAVNIEGFGGTNLGDSFKGNSADNYFEGNDGADTMTGGAGSDAFGWWSQDHFGDGDRITDFRSGTDSLGFEVSEFQGMTGTVTLVNGRNATAARGTFVFDASNDTLYWDRDGTGSAVKVAVVVLEGVSRLSVDDFDMWL